MAKNINRKVTIYINGKEIENTIKSIRAEIVKLEREQKTLPIGSEEYKKKMMEIANLKRILQDQSVTIKNMGESWKSTVETAAEYSNILMGIQSAFQMFDLAIGKVKDLAADAAKMDDALGMVMKTTGLTHEEVEKLNEAFKKMDTRTSREQLNDLAYQAGKLGFNTTEAVQQFVEAADQINIALGDVLGDNATLEIAKLANVYSQSTDIMEGKDLKGKMLAVGSAVNQLGKESTASESYMVDFMGRLGGVATQAGLSADQILGYASALDQQKQKLEMSATAFQKLIQQMIKKPQEFLEAARMPLGEFKKLMETDMNAAIKRVLEGFNQMGGLTALVPVFKDMGLDGARAASVVASLASNLDKVNEAQATANEHLMLANSMNKEYITMNNTKQAQREKALKNFNEQRLLLGNELYPVIISLQKSGTVLMKGFSGFIQLCKENKAIMPALIATLVAWNRVRLMNLATSIKEKAEAAFNIALKKQEERQTKRNIVTIAKHRETIEKKRLATLRAKLAEEQLIATMKVEEGDYTALTMKAAAEVRVKELNAKITKQNIAIDEAHTRVIKAKGAAFKATPWGLVISALAAIAVKTVEVVRNSNKWKIHQTMKEVSKEVGATAYKVDMLFKNLQKATVGSQQYNRALEELKREYPEIIRKHIDEAGKLKDIKKAYDEVSEAARNSIFERVRAAKLEEAAGDTAETVMEQVEQIRNTIYSQAKKKGKENMAAIIFGDVEDAIKKLESGKASVQQVYREIQAIQDKYGITPTGEAQGGKTVRMYDYIDRHVQRIGYAYQKFNELTRAYEEKLGKSDPYQLQKKSLEELQEELTRTRAQIENLKRAQDNQGDYPIGMTDYTQQIAAHLKKIKAIEEAISKMKSESASTVVENNDDSPLITGGFDDKELQKWERVKERAERMMADFNTKAESGLLRLRDEVRNKTDQMIKDIEESVGATDAQKKALIAQVQSAARAYEQAKIEAYIKKQTDALEKMRKQLKGTEATGYLGKIEEAARNLAGQIQTIDEAIAQAQVDADAAAAAMVGKSDEEKAALQGQIDELNNLIAAYRNLKREFAANAYNNIVDVDKIAAKPLSGDESQQSDRARNKAQDARESPLGWLFDESTFEQYGHALDEINKKYTKQSEELERAASAETEILKRLNQEREDACNNNASDEEIEALDRQIELHEQNADRIETERIRLDGLRKSAEDAAKEDAFGTATEKWIAGIEKFGSMAMELWGNINKILDNISQKAINELEDEREAATKNLDEQLEEGLISQDEYNEQKEALDKEYDDKEKELQLEQWKRQQALNVGQAVMQGALAVLQALASAPPPYNAILAAISAGLAAVQIAAIASEPAPYAKGGYVDRDTTFYRAGEAGPEWVASNQLLNDRTTAPIIQALEDYQRGDRHALADIPMSRLDVPAAMKASQSIGRGQVVVQQPAAASIWEHPTAAAVGTDSRELVSLMRELVTYEKDPRNRQAVISRQTMKDFDNNEDFLRSRARL